MLFNVDEDGDEIVNVNKIALDEDGDDIVDVEENDRFADELMKRNTVPLSGVQKQWMSWREEEEQGFIAKDKRTIWMRSPSLHPDILQNWNKLKDCVERQTWELQIKMKNKATGKNRSQSWGKKIEGKVDYHKQSLE